MSDESRGGARDGAPAFFFSTPVWGSNHLDLFLTIGLPSLLAPGNLPALSNGPASRFIIYTHPKEEAQLRAAPVFSRLATTIPVDILPLPDDMNEPHRAMSECHLDTMASADRANAAAVFIPPDCVWSDGSFLRLEELAASGKSIVYISGVRLDRDAAAPELRDRLSAGGTVLQVAGGDLVRLGLRHLHPVAHSHFWNEHDGRLMPANLAWTVADEGILLRCFHLHPLMVKSQVPFAKFNGTIDDDLPLRACPDSAGDYVIVDSQEMLTFELSGLDRNVGTVCAKGSIDGVAAWVEYGTNRHHRRLVDYAIRLHVGSMTDAAWRAVEAESLKIVRRIKSVTAHSWPVLMIAHRSVLLGRLVAITLGRGNHSNGTFAKFTATVLRNFYSMRQRSFAALFLRNGEPILTHPGWLVRRAALRAMLDDVRTGDRRIAAIGLDDVLLRQLRRALPNREIEVLDSMAVSQDRARQPSDRFDLAIALRLGDDGLAPPDSLRDLAAKGTRSVWLVARTVSPRPVGGGIAVHRYGGLGIGPSLVLLRAVHRMRMALTESSLVIRVLVAAMGPLIMPIVYSVAAGAGLAVNLVGLLLDGLDRRKPTTSAGKL